MEEQKVVVIVDESKEPQKSLEYPQWQWQSDVDPWKDEDRSKWTWQNYSPEDCMTIQKAFSENQEIADLGNYEINFEKKLQIKKSDRDRIRRVRKQEKSRFLKEILQAKTFPQDLNLVEESRGLMNALFGYVVDQRVFLYIGAVMAKERFEDYDLKKMKYFSWNLRISASKNMKVALEYVKFSLDRSQEEEEEEGGKIGVVFVVETDTTALQECEGMLDFSEESKYKDEQEVLIAPGTIFELREIRMTENNINEISVKALRNPQGGDIVKNDNNSKILVQKLTLDKIKNLGGTNSIEKLEIRNSEINEKMMEELDVLREKVGLKKENISFMSNTIYISSLGVLGHYYSEGNVNKIYKENKVIFKNGESSTEFKIRKLLLEKDALWKFKINKQLAELCEKIKIESPHLTSLEFDLKDCGIQDQEMRTLLDSLRDLENLESLTLKLDRNNVTKPENFDHLCAVVESLKTLKSLNLKFAECVLFKDKGLERLQDMLCLLKPTLEDLLLDFSACESLTEKGFEPLKKGLGSLKSLKTLDIDFRSCKNISNKGLVYLKDSLMELKSLESLSLKFERCPKIGSEGLGYMVIALSQLKSLSSLLLDFSGCGTISEEKFKSLKGVLKPLTSLDSLTLRFAGYESWSDAGLKELTEGFSFKSLRNLELDLSTSGISDGGLTHLKDGLIGMESLQKLCLIFKGCDQISNLGLSEIKKLLIPLTSLETLTLQLDNCKKITDDGFNDLKTAFALLPALKNLSLYFKWCEQLSYKAFKYLRGGLVFLNSLENLVLNFWDCNQINDEGLNQLKPALASLKSLQKLCLTFYNCQKISNKGLSYLKDGLMPLRSLKHLSLDFWRCDQISDEGMGHLKVALVLLPNLEWLSFDFNGCGKITAAGLGYLKDALVELRSLNNVYLSFKFNNHISSSNAGELKGVLTHIPNFNLWTGG